MLRNRFTLSFLVVTGCLLLSNALRAERIVTALDPLEAGGAHLKTPATIALSSKKPEGIKREPVYRFKPAYASLSLGDAKESPFHIVLDSEPGATRPILYLDLNRDGDLTANPGLKLVAAPNSTEKNPVFSGSVSVVALYNIAGRGGKMPSKLTFSLIDNELKVNTDYGRVGTLNVGSRTYKIALIDNQVTAKYDEFKHEEDAPAKLSLLIDRNADGKIDPEREVFDVAKPIKIAGQVLNVASIDSRGTRMIFEGTLKKRITPDMLKPGGEIIDFEAKLMNGKTVTFPDDYKGKFVLLQFWATWCPPCREELPGLIKTYRAFNDKNFEILAVSLDRGGITKDLNQIIIQNGMNWDHVYDGRYWDAEIAKLFNIKAIPDAFLVDGDTGKIIAMGNDLRPPHLGEILKEAIARKQSKE
jgi:thiol-disulfide isomerase/thioredoxin